MQNINIQNEQGIHAVLACFTKARLKKNKSFQKAEVKFAEHAQSQTRTSETEAKYRKRAGQLKCQFERHTGMECNTILDCKRFIYWLISRKPEYLPSTWRFYKAATIFSIEDGTLPTSSAGVAILKATNNDGCSTTKKNTSSKKPKKIPEADFTRLVDYLDEKKGTWAYRTSNWLQSGVIAGVRPCEWIGAVLRDEGGNIMSNDPGYKRHLFWLDTYFFPDHRELYTLTVRNAKATNGRGNGEYRDISLSLTEDELFMIAFHIFEVNDYMEYGKYETYYSNCRNTLYRACKRLFKNRNKQYTFYSARHQCIANRKAAGESKSGTARASGHASLETAKNHYGRKSSGWKNVPHQIIDADIDDFSPSLKSQSNGGPKM